MAVESKILTIDVGSDSVKMAEFSFAPEGGNLILEKFAFEPLAQGDDEPVVAFARVYQFMLQSNNFQARQVRMSISGQAAFSRLSKLPELSGDDDMISKIIEFEAKQTVPYTMDEIIWDYQLIKHTLPPVTELDDPHDEYEALFVAAKRDIITAYTDVVLESGMEVISVNIAPVAMANAFYACTKRELDNCEMLLNIGGQSSSLVICEGDRIFVRTIPIAGDAITQQISKEFAIPFAEAEDLKGKHGFVALGGAYEDPESEVAATISKIARNVMTRLHGEISRSINVWRSQYNGKKPTALYLAGGGTLIQYVTEFFTEKLHIKVDYLNVFSAMGIGPAVDREALLDVAPMFAELAGMGVRSAAEVPVDINLVPETIKVQADIQSKTMYFYASCATLLVTLLLFYAGVSKMLNFDRSRVDRVKDKVEAAQALNEQIKEQYGAVSEKQNEYNRYLKIIKDRTLWVELLEELQNITPDTTWYSSIEGIADRDADRRLEEANRNKGTAASADAAPANQGGGFAGIFGGGNNPPPAGNAPPPADPAMNPDGTPIEQAPPMKEINYIKIKGYSLILKEEIIGDALRNLLKKSKLFRHETEEVIIDLDVREAGDNNIAAFTAYLKLINPMRY